MIESYNDGTHRYCNGNEIGLILLKLRYDKLTAEGTNQTLTMGNTIGSRAASDRLAQALEFESNTV
ncbi:hypothetical protein [Staphylococcus simulans]